MSFYITQLMVPQSKYWLKCPYLMDWEAICIHNTANRASAMAEASYMVGNNLTVSWHYAVDDYRAVQCLPLNRNGWHAGDGGAGPGNRKTVGVEICYSLDAGDARYPKAQANAAILVARLLNSKKYGTDRIKIHRDFSGKYCPHRMLDNGHWPTFFKAQVQAILDKINGVKPTKPVTPPATPGIKVGDMVSITGTHYSTGETIPAWVKKKQHKVGQISGTKALLGYPNGIMSWAYLKDLQKAGSPMPSPKPVVDKSGAIRVGDWVSVTGTKYTTGQTIPDWVKRQQHAVASIFGNSALLGHPGGINSWVALKDLTKPTASFKPYVVRVRISNLNMKAGAGTGYNSNGFIKPGVYTIIEEKAGPGARLWGKLKSGAGWIALDFAEKLAR